MKLNSINNKKMVFIIVLFTFLLYGNSIKNGYSMDDSYVTVTNDKIPNNPRIEKGLKGIPVIFSTHYMFNEKQKAEYRPIPLTTFAVEYEIFGSNPHVSHFINVLIYCFSNIVVYLVLFQLFNRFSVFFPILVTLLFMAHPIHTEVVNNIKCRDELLSFLFGITSFYFIIKYVEIKKIIYILASVLLITLSLLSKKTGLIFIPLIPITLYYFFNLKLRQIIYLSLLVSIGYVFYNLIEVLCLNSAETNRTIVFFENPLEYDNNFVSRVSLVFYSIGYYLKLLVLPNPLCCYYGYNTIPINEWGSPIVIFSIIVYASLLIFIIIKVKQKNVLSFSILVYLLGIFPFSNLIAIAPGIIAERFIYFASFGFCISVVYLFFVALKVDISNVNLKLRELPFLFKGIFILVFIIFFLLTFLRNKKWKSELSIYETDVAAFPNSCNLQYMLGNIYYNNYFNTTDENLKVVYKEKSVNYYKKAAIYMNEGATKYPKDIVNQNNLGTLYINVFNDPKSALPLFENVLKTNPLHKEARFNKAFCLEKLNMMDSAIVLYEKILEEKPIDLVSYFRLKDLYFLKKKYKLVVNNAKLALRDYPNNFKLYIDVGNGYMLLNDTINGLKYFNIALTKDPNNFGLKKSIENMEKLHN